ncbi:cation transporter [Sphingobacterium daejeonense]|uniref:cation transporter n=1 Tax=Sphingobacterium daejeonense TaxID=371142 RepID=UPI0010C32EBF|nr:Copper-exporting P-type ATPase A [Sphingobacterium daejeonense]
MTCASCAGSAESIVKYQPGVVNASVNFATGNLTVEYLPNMTDASTLQKAVQGVGYDLLIEDKTKQQETLEAIHEKKFRTLKNKTIWAIILSLPVVIIGMFFMDMPYADPIMWLFSTPVVIWLGRDFFCKRLEAGKAPFRQYGYAGGIEYRYCLPVQCFQYAVCRLLASTGTACSRIF